MKRQKVLLLVQAERLATVCYAVLFAAGGKVVKTFSADIEMKTRTQLATAAK